MVMAPICHVGTHKFETYLAENVNTNPPIFRPAFPPCFVLKVDADDHCQISRSLVNH